MLELRLAQENRGRVADFQRRHRLGLLSLLVVHVGSSGRHEDNVEDAAANLRIREAGRIASQSLGEFAEAEPIGASEGQCFAVFAKPSDAVQFALLTQSRIRTELGEGVQGLSCRIAIHVGEVVVEEPSHLVSESDLYALQVDIVARVSLLAREGQIVLTRSAFDSARQVLRGEDVGTGIGSLGWMNHGLYQVSDLDEPLEICEVGELAFAPLLPPPDSQFGTRFVAPDQEPVLGWRPALGQVIPNTPWILEQKLGEGGFGEVWIVRHQTLQHRRVSKFCFGADRVRALKREATLFRILKEEVGNHPHIVGIQEVFFDQPPFYIIMDYAEGKDLRAWCEEQGGASQVPLPVRLEIVAQIGEALNAAHNAGVIHRDVKPSNIIISEKKLEASVTEGTEGASPPAVVAKLTDFGIGQVVSQQVLAGLTRMGFTVTMMGSGTSGQAGTPMYIAPELLAGQPASVQSDIYSLGVILWQLLAGNLSRPLTSDWTKEISDPFLRLQIMDCVAGHPQERLRNVGQLVRSLASYNSSRPGIPGTAMARAARSTPGLGCAFWFFMGLAAFIFVVWVLFMLEEPASPLRKTGHEEERVSWHGGDCGERRCFLHASKWGIERVLQQFRDAELAHSHPEWGILFEIAQTSAASDLFIEFCEDLTSTATDDFQLQVKVHTALTHFYAYRGQKELDVWRSKAMDGYLTSSSQQRLRSVEENGNQVLTPADLVRYFRDQRATDRSAIPPVKFRLPLE